MDTLYNNIQVLVYQPEFQLQFSKTSSGRFYPKVIPIMVKITYMDGPWSKHCIWFMLIRPIIGIPTNRYMI